MSIRTLITLLNMSLASNDGVDDQQSIPNEELNWSAASGAIPKRIERSTSNITSNCIHEEEQINASTGYELQTSYNQDLLNDLKQLENELYESCKEIASLKIQLFRSDDIIEQRSLNKHLYDKINTYQSFYEADNKGNQAPYDHECMKIEQTRKKNNNILKNKTSIYISNNWDTFTLVYEKVFTKILNFLTYMVNNVFSKKNTQKSMQFNPYSRKDLEKILEMMSMHVDEYLTMKNLSKSAHKSQNQASKLVDNTDLTKNVILIRCLLQKIDSVMHKIYTDKNNNSGESGLITRFQEMALNQIKEIDDVPIYQIKNTNSPKEVVKKSNNPKKERKRISLRKNQNKDSSENLTHSINEFDVDTQVSYYDEIQYSLHNKRKIYEEKERSFTCLINDAVDKIEKWKFFLEQASITRKNCEIEKKNITYELYRTRDIIFSLNSQIEVTSNKIEQKEMKKSIRQKNIETKRLEQQLEQKLNALERALNMEHEGFKRFNEAEEHLKLVENSYKQWKKEQLDY